MKLRWGIRGRRAPRTPPRGRRRLTAECRGARPSAAPRVGAAGGRAALARPDARYSAAEGGERAGLAPQAAGGAGTAMPDAAPRPNARVRRNARLSTRQKSGGYSRTKGTMHFLLIRCHWPREAGPEAEADRRA